MLDTVLQGLFQMETGCATEYNKVKQGVATQTVGTMNRHARHFAYRKQPVNDLVITVCILGHRLAMNVSGNATHHVVTGRDHRHRSSYRINVREGLRQLADTR